MQFEERPERHGQHGNVGDNDDAVVSVVEGYVVDTGAPVAGRKVERYGIALEERYAEYGDHAACVDSLQSVHGIPEWFLNACESLVERQDRRFDEAQDGVVHQDDEPLVQLGCSLLLQIELLNVPVVDSDIACLHVYSRQRHFISSVAEAYCNLALMLSTYT